jgi:hypothetical protein
MVAAAGEGERKSKQGGRQAGHRKPQAFVAAFSESSGEPD